jgi:predicted small secreted protein
MMKKVLFTALFVSFSIIVTSTITSCKTNEGCGLEEKYAPPTGKDGRLSTKRGKSNLFSKKQRKKMKKRGQ